MKKITTPTWIPKQPGFWGYDVDEPWLVPGYKRNLPHLRLTHATYFVTFRLSDSLPKSVIKGWLQERHDWLKLHGIDSNLSIRDPEKFLEIYFNIPLGERYKFEHNQRQQFFIELDNSHGCCHLKNAQAHGIVAEALEFFHGNRVWCGDYVVMPNHVHVLVQPFPGVKLEEWLYSIKRFASGKIIKNTSLDSTPVRRHGHLWQMESYDHIVRNLDELARIRRYIANNPRNLRTGSFALKSMKWLDELRKESRESDSTG